MASPQTFGRRGASPPGAQHGLPPGEPPHSGLDHNSKGLNWLLFSLQGRSPRLHYWFGQVGLIVFYRIIVAVAKAISHSMGPNDGSHTNSPLAITAVLVAALFIFVALGAGLWVGFALVVKRWHDRDKSWVWALLGFLPIIGWVWQGIECGFLEGTLGPNRYGPSPKGIAGVLYSEPLTDARASLPGRQLE